VSELQTVMAALATALAAALPARVVTRDLVEINLRKEAELRLGIFTPVARGEAGFQNKVRGREADLGTLEVLLIAQIQIASNTAPSAIEDAEGGLIDDVKTLCRAVPNTFDFVYLNSWRNSSQVDHPYGWVVFDLSVRLAS
jgi:hypothetical protein